MQPNWGANIPNNFNMMNISYAKKVAVEEKLQLSVQAEVRC